MTDSTTDLLKAVQEIRDLLRIVAEPAIAEHDKRARSELRRLVGSSTKKAKAALLMDGTRIQSAIQRESGIDAGDLSKFVKQLSASKLLSGEGKEPTLAISIPKTFFEEKES